MAKPLPPKDRLHHLRVIANNSKPIDLFGFAALILVISATVIVYLARFEGLVWATPMVLMAITPAVMFWYDHCRHREMGAELQRRYKQMPDEDLAVLYESYRIRANRRLMALATILGLLLVWLTLTG